MLSRNLKYLRKQKGATQEQVAHSIGITRSALADYENGKSEPKANTIIKLSKIFDVNLEDLLTTNIDMPLFHKSSSTKLNRLHNQNVRVVAITVQENQKQNIEFVPVSAIAGYALNLSSPEFVKELPHFSIPKLTEGTYRAFEIKGDSMPPIDEDFVVIGKYVENFSEFKSGKRYVFILKEDGVVFKRVINEIAQNSRLILVSDSSEYLPYSVKITDVLEAWEMVSFIGYTTKKTDFNQTILDKLHSIEKKIENFSAK